MKVGTEIVLTQDATFSFAIAGMNPQDRYDAEQIIQDTAMEVYDNIFKDMLHDKYFNKGKTGVFLFYHNDSRNPLSPSSHVHMVIPNVIQLADGTIRAVEMPEMRDKNFHDMIDMQYKSRLIQRWNERFKDLPVEAYDKDRQRITSPTQEVKDFRVAYDEESLRKIHDQSVADELINKYIKYQKDDMRGVVDSKLKIVDQEIVELTKKLSFEDKLPTGTLISHGEDNYFFDAKNTKSYYVKLSVRKPDGKEKEQIYWGVDLKRAIESSKSNIGDLVVLEKSKSDPKNPKEKSTFNISVDHKNMEILNSIDDLEVKMARINKKYSNQIAYMGTTKHRNKVWKVIKERKKGGSIINKTIENKKIHEALAPKIAVDPGIGMKEKKFLEIIETLTSTTPYINKNALVYEIAKSSPVGFNAQKMADELIAKSLESELLVATGTLSKTQTAYTTWELINKEYENIELMKKLHNTEQKYKIYNVKKEIDLVEDKPEYKDKGIKSNKEQIEMIESVFSDRKGQICIGLPGTGKSLSIKICTEIAHKHGFRTIGCAFTNKVSTALDDETLCDVVKTVDKLLHDIESGKLKLNGNDIVFVDEASQIGTRQYNKLLNAVVDAKAKIVLIGDPNQINSINTGNTLNEFLRDSEIRDNVVFLTDIRRQKNETALTVAETSSLKEVYKDEATFRRVKKEGSHVEKVFTLLEQAGCVHNKFITNTETIEAISKAYINNVNDYKDKLLIAATNESIDRINDKIQDRRIELGQVVGKPYIAEDSKFFYKGDRIVMEKNTKEYKNGDFGTITNIDPTTNKITIEFDNSKTKTFDNPKKLNYLMVLRLRKLKDLLQMTH